MRVSAGTLKLREVEKAREGKVRNRRHDIGPRTTAAEEEEEEEGVDDEAVIKTGEDTTGGDCDVGGEEDIDSVVEIAAAAIGSEGKTFFEGSTTSRRCCEGNGVEDP